MPISYIQIYTWEQAILILKYFKYKSVHNVGSNRCLSFTIRVFDNFDHHQVPWEVS